MGGGCVAAGADDVRVIDRRGRVLVLQLERMMSQRLTGGGGACVVAGADDVTAIDRSGRGLCCSWSG